jgi:opine dehydrogenase
MNITVLGSGNGGCALAYEWAANGHRVSLFDFEHFPKMIAQIQEKGGLTSKGKLEGTVSFHYIGHDLEKALEDSELIFVVGPAYSTKPFGEACKPYVKKGQIYVVCPSSCFGSIVFKNALGLPLDDTSVAIAETSTLPYAVRITREREAEITIYNHLKGGYYLAALPATLNKKVFDAVTQVNKDYILADNVVQTTLQNGNPTIHPAVSLLNVARIENAGEFMFYEEGVTPGVGRLMKAVDDEKISIAKAFNVTVLPDSLIGVNQGYMTINNYDTGYSTAPGFKGIKAQNNLDYRYFHEDVGYTMVCLIDLADLAGVEVPTMRAIVHLVSVVMDRDYLAEAKRTLKTLGLAGLNKEEILRLVGNV